MKNTLLGMLAVVSLVVAGAEPPPYDETTGFVTLTKSDSSSVHSLTGPGNWSDGLAPHTGTNYYAAAGLFLRPAIENDATHFTFPAPLYLAGTVNYGNLAKKGTWRFEDLHLLPGGKLGYYTLGDYQGNYTIHGTQEQPSFIDFARKTTELYTMKFNGVVHGSADACVRYLGTGPEYTRLRISGSWADYLGTLIISTNEVLYVDSYSANMSGTIIFEPRAWHNQTSSTKASSYGALRFTSDNVFDAWLVSVTGELDTGTNCLANLNNVLSVGSLVAREGTHLNYQRENAVINVAERFVLDGAVSFYVDGFAFSLTETPEPRVLVRLAPNAVAAGLPSLDAVTYTTKDPRNTLYIEYRDDPECAGGKVLVLASKPIVSWIGNDEAKKSKAGGEWAATPYPSLNPDVDHAALGTWADGRFPHADAAYYLYYERSVNVGNIVIQGPTADAPNRTATFPGGSLFADDLACVSLRANACVPDLRLRRRGSVFFDTANVHLSGKVTIIPISDTYYSYFRKNTGGNCYIDATIVGDTPFTFHAYYPKTYPVFYLTADNRTFTSQIGFTRTMNAESIEPSWDVHTRVVVGSGTALGGACAAFMHNALYLKDYVEVRITNTTDLAETTRGILVEGNGVLNVDAGAKVKVAAPITLVGTLRKNGGGTLTLAGGVRFGLNDDLADVTAPIAESNQVQVAEGALKVAHGSSLAMSFAEDTTLLVDAASGPVDLTGEGASLTVEAGRMRVSVDSETTTFDEEGLKVAAFVVSAANVEEVLAKVRAKSPWKGVRATFVVEEADGKATISLVHKRVGMCINIH